MTYEEVKEQVSIDTVLTYYGAEVPSIGGGWNDWKGMRCPFHGPDRRPSAGVNRKHQVFFCFTCDVKGDIYGVVSRWEGITRPQAKKLIEERFL